MTTCYWELNPRALFQKNPHSEKIMQENGGEIPDNIKELFTVYEECSSQCILLQNSIDQYNFKDVMKKIFELEAQLSEISFYLEEIDISFVQEDLLLLIQREYLLDYYEKLSNSYIEGHFLISCMREKVQKQRSFMFGKDNLPVQ